MAKLSDKTGKGITAEQLTELMQRVGIRSGMDGAGDELISVSRNQLLAIASAVFANVEEKLGAKVQEGQGALGAGAEALRQAQAKLERWLSAEKEALAAEKEALAEERRAVELQREQLARREELVAARERQAANGSKKWVSNSVAGGRQHVEEGGSKRDLPPGGCPPGGFHNL